MNDLRQFIVPHRAWLRASRDLAQSVAIGAGMVVVVGGRGTGKSLLLAELAALLAGSGVAAQVRTPRTARAADCQMDLVDEVDVAALAVLAGEAAPPKLRVIAIRADGPGIAVALRALSPRLRIVALGGLDSADVQAIIEARLAGSGLPRGALTARASAKIRKVSGGNPAAVDRMISAAIRLARAAGSDRVLGEHVDQAAGPERPAVASPMASLALTARTPVVAAPPAPAVETVVPYRSIVADLAALTAAAMEADEIRQTVRRRRTGLAAALVGTAAIGAVTATGPVRLSSAWLAAKGGIIRMAAQSLPHPDRFSLPD